MNSVVAGVLAHTALPRTAHWFDSWLGLMFTYTEARGNCGGGCLGVEWFDLSNQSQTNRERRIMQFVYLMVYSARHNP